MLGVIYHEGRYFVQEPWADRVFRKDPDSAIEKHAWLILRFMPKQRAEVRVNDVVRFGRVSFKVTELVLTQE